MIHLETLRCILDLANDNRCTCQSNSYKRCVYCAAKEFVRDLADNVEYFMSTWSVKQECVVRTVDCDELKDLLDQLCTIIDRRLWRITRVACIHSVDFPVAAYVSKHLGVPIVYQIENDKQLLLVQAIFSLTKDYSQLKTVALFRRRSHAILPRLYLQSIPDEVRIQFPWQ